MFDALSAALTLFCIGALSKRRSVGSAELLRKGENLISGVLSAVVLFSGLTFAYNSLERLMYPTPIWFSMRYFYIVAGTAAAKLILFAVYKRMNKELDSSAVRVMTYDCILDFFVTAVTLISLIASATGFFSADAICGTVISIIIILGALKMLRQSIKGIIGYVPYEVREEIEELLKTAGVDTDKVDARFECGEETVCYLTCRDRETQEKAEKIYSEIINRTSVKMKTVKETENDG